MQINNPKHLCLDEVDGDVFDIVLFFNSKAKYLSYTFVFVFAFVFVFVFIFSTVITFWSYFACFLFPF